MFRHAVEADIPALLEMQQRFFADAGDPLDVEASGNAMRELIGDSNMGRLFVASVIPSEVEGSPASGAGSRLSEGDPSTSLGMTPGHTTGGIVAYLVIGFGFSLEFGGRDAFVDELYVAPEARGRGLGTAALALAEDECRSAGIRALHLEVAHENHRARALYARRGYAAHERHLMTRRLT